MSLFCFGNTVLQIQGGIFLHRREIDRMADNQTEKQKVQELTDKLERGLTEFFNRNIPVIAYQRHFAL